MQRAQNERRKGSPVYLLHSGRSCQHFVKLYLQVKLSCLQREGVWGRGGGLPYKPRHEVEWLASRTGRFTAECPLYPRKKSLGEPHSRPERFGEEYIYFFWGGGAGCCTTIPECISIRHAVSSITLGTTTAA